MSTMFRGPFELDQDSWKALEAYLCSLTREQRHYDLENIQLDRPVQVGARSFEPGTYVKSHVEIIA